MDTDTGQWIVIAILLVATLFNAINNVNSARLIVKMQVWVSEQIDKLKKSLP